MTREELATECERRLKMRTHTGMTHDAYIRTAVIVMFEVMSEAISAATAAKG